MSTLWKVINCIMFVSDLQQVGGFLWVFYINKTDFHGITKILLKVALNTTNQLSSYICITYWNSICHEWFQEGPFQTFFLCHLEIQDDQPSQDMVFTPKHFWRNYIKASYINDHLFFLLQSVHFSYGLEFYDPCHDRF